MDEKQLKRLSDCEVLINKYHQQMQLFLSKCDVFEKDIMTKEKFEDFISRTKSNFYQEIETIEEKLDKIFVEIDWKSKSIDRLDLLGNKLIDNQNELTREIENNSSSIDFLKQKNSEMQKNLEFLNLRMPNKEKIQQDHLELKNRFLEIFEDLQIQIDVLRKSISEEGANIRNLQGIISNNNDMNKKLHSDSRMSLDQVKSKINEINGNQNHMVQGLKQYVDQKIDSFSPPKEPQLPDFKKLVEDMSKSFMVQYEDDSKKFLKGLDISLLNDLQIKVMSKKLDAILGILEKNKLS